MIRQSLHRKQDNASAESLDEALDRLSVSIDRLRVDNDRLKAINAELLAMLEHVGVEGHRFGSVQSDGCAECCAARAAIARAEGRPS